MRRNRETQLPIFGLRPDHRLAEELRAVSKILDHNPSILDLFLHDLCDTAHSGQEAPGLSTKLVTGTRSRRHKTAHTVLPRRRQIPLSPALDSNARRKDARDWRSCATWPRRDASKRSWCCLRTGSASTRTRSCCWRSSSGAGWHASSRRRRSSVCWFRCSA